MYKNTKRAERRHHYRRLKNRRIDRNYWGRSHQDFPLGWTSAHLGMATDTPCACSCTMCGNPRKHFGEVTLAEKRHSDSEDDQLDDFWNGQN